MAAHELDREYGDAYEALYVREARIITTELELKLAALRPTPEDVDYSGADRLIGLAGQHGLKARGHTLIWNDWLPGWVKSLSNAGIERLLETHIAETMGRYRGRIHSWDVVNEPTAYWEQNPGMLRGGPFLSALGEDYIARSFRAARAADPGARLILNEAWTERSDDPGLRTRAAFLALIRRLKEKDVPLDGVGLESHLDASHAYDFDRYARYVEELSSLGLQIQITELDVDDTRIAGGIEERDRLVASLYERYLTALLPNPRVTALITWQLSDRTTGIGSDAAEKGRTLPHPPRPLPFDENFEPKPARDAIARALAAAPKR